MNHHLEAWAVELLSFLRWYFHLTSNVALILEMVFFHSSSRGCSKRAPDFSFPFYHNFFLVAEGSGGLRCSASSVMAIRSPSIWTRYARLRRSRWKAGLCWLMPIFSTLFTTGYANRRPFVVISASPLGWLARVYALLFGRDGRFDVFQGWSWFTYLNLQGRDSLIISVFICCILYSIFKHERQVNEPSLFSNSSRGTLAQYL